MYVKYYVQRMRLILFVIFEVTILCNLVQFWWHLHEVVTLEVSVFVFVSMVTKILHT